MFGQIWLTILVAPLAVSTPPTSPGGLLAYFGLGPGAELIPYFMALLGFAGAAFLAVVQWPLQALYRRFSRTKGGGLDDRHDEAAVVKGERLEDAPDTNPPSQQDAAAPPPS
ncbi:MAG TPA: hypothetical protein VGX78_18895 [Pirellulales bacterium]|jgi:hypothetical protein|nr:hypothetical protein [Pirellulales bacterium]